MARNRRATTTPEKKAPAPSPPEVKTENRPLWIPVLSAASVVAILASSYFLLKIYAPFLSELPLSGDPGKAVVGAGLVIGVVGGLIKLLLKSEPLAPVRTALAKAVSLVFERRRVALILAPVALVLALGTWQHWQASARCPILRIQPDGALAYYLEDGEDADKPPQKTFEIRVRWKDQVRRFHPRDDRTLDVGASESVLRWRAGRETQEKDPPKRSYLGTDRFHAGDEVTIEVVCRNPDGLSLGRVTTTIDDHQEPVETVRLMVDEEEFSRKVGTCEPI
jgi:hypothetical protein